jgi:hypothetical protein
LQNIVPHFNNVLFNRDSVRPGLPTADIKAAMRDPANFIGKNESRFDVEGQAESGAATLPIAPPGGLWWTVGTTVTVILATLTV